MGCFLLNETWPKHDWFTLPLKKTPGFHTLLRARCPLNSTRYSCSVGCEWHWRHRRQNTLISLSPSASGQLQTGQTSKLLVLFSLGLNFLPALEKDERKMAVEQQLIKSNNSLGVSCSPQKPSEGCTREFTDIMENTASVLAPFREKETSADIAAIFREIERTWTVILHSMGES